MTLKPFYSIMFVCLGNICRSPTAEAVLIHLAKKRGLNDSIHVESSAIGSWNLGEAPDQRSSDHAITRGVQLNGRAKLFKSTDFQQYDYILGADLGIVDYIKSEAQEIVNQNKVHLMTFCSAKFKNQPIPDPYQGGQEGFVLVFDMIEDSCKGLLDYLF